ncbi:MAG: Apea-like [Labilithrix sp.]|nr:Apea-like [Labilithrix sp.]
MTESRWTWGSQAPDAWYADRANGAVMIRGYLALGSRTPDSAEELAAWSANFDGRDLHVSFVRGSLEVPPPITFHFTGGENVAVHRSEQPAKLPPAVYVVLSVPVRAHYRGVTDDAEREAIARLDSAAGLIAVAISPNAIYQQVFEFIAEASGPGTRVMSPPVRRPLAEHAVLNEDAMLAMRDVLRAVGVASDRIQARATTSLRWYAQAQAERSRVEAFVKFWIALEAIAFDGDGSPAPLINLLAAHYTQPVAWVRDTFAINQLAQLRNGIVHSGRRPMLHGNVLTFVDALYVDALRARLRLTNERRAERALPEGTSFNVRRWQHSGAVKTAYLPDVPDVPDESAR